MRLTAFRTLETFTALRALGPLEALDCFIHSVGFDLGRESSVLLAGDGPHQVTYEAVASLLHI